MCGQRAQRADAGTPPHRRPAHETRSAQNKRAHFCVKRVTPRGTFRLPAGVPRRGVVGLRTGDADKATRIRDAARGNEHGRLDATQLLVYGPKKL